MRHTPQAQQSVEGEYKCMKNTNLLSGRHITSQRKKNGIYNSIFKSEEKKRKKQKNTTRKDLYLYLFLGG